MAFPRRFGQYDPTAQEPEEAPEMESMEEVEEAPESDEEIMSQVEQAPIDEEHVEQEANEPAIIQYLEEQLGIEIPQHMYAKIEEYMASKGGSSEEQNPVVPEKPKAVYRSFGQPG